MTVCTLSQTGPTVYDTYMESSTLILTALAQLNEELISDDGFDGYNDDLEGTTRLLDELWTLYSASHFPAEDPEELVSAWYENFFAHNLP